MKPNIDPKVDCVFKAILGSEEHKRLLVHFLNAVLGRKPGIRVQAVELLNPYNDREFETDKLSIVDVKARDETGRWYQIEIQLAVHAGLAARMLYTWCAIYHSQLKQGDPFTELQPVIAIWLLNESLFDLPGAYHLPFVPWNREHALTLTDHLRLDVLQLPLWPGPQAQVEELDRWLCLFRDGEQVDVDAPPGLLQTDEMKEAMTVLQHFSENQRNYLLYQQRREAEHLAATLQQEFAQLKQREADARQREADARQREADARQQAERERQAKEQATQQAERERQQAERERQEKARLLRLLQQAGIDPNQDG